MSRIFDDVASLSQWIANALESSGYGADFTPASFHEIDRFIDEHSSGGKVKPRGLLAEGLGMKLFALGAYVGETVRRQLGGEWYADESDPEGEIDTSLKLASGGVIFPVQRIMKRYSLGREESIAVYGIGLGILDH